MRALLRIRCSTKRSTCAGLARLSKKMGGSHKDCPQLKYADTHSKNSTYALLRKREKRRHEKLGARSNTNKDRLVCVRALVVRVGVIGVSRLAGVRNCPHDQNGDQLQGTKNNARVRRRR